MGVVCKTFEHCRFFCSSSFVNCKPGPIMGDDSNESVYDELWDLLTCHRTESWLQLPSMSCSTNLFNPPSSTPLEFKDSLQPFPWTRGGGQSPGSPSDTGPGKAVHRGNCMSCWEEQSSMFAGNKLSSKQTHCMSRSSSPTGSATTPSSVRFDSPCDDLAFLDYKLPPPGVTAGRVLQHAKSVMLTLFQKNQPMIFKIGYSHNPLWRWSNTIYGYKFDPDKWSNMVVLFESTEASGPAMLEACLIDMFRGTWSKFQCMFSIFYQQMKQSPLGLCKWMVPRH